MIRINLASVVLLAASILGCSAWAQDEPTTARAKQLYNTLNAADFLYDEEALNASVKEIASLRAREAEALARALADCSYPHMPGDLGPTPCARSRGYFIVVGPEGSPLGNLFSTLHYYSLAWVGRTSGGPRPVEDQRHVARMQMIENAWTKAVKLRLQYLDRE